MAGKYQSWALTFRPRNGVTEHQLDLLERWCKSTTNWYHIGVEKDDIARHAHIVVYRRFPSTRSNMVNLIIKTAFHNSLDAEEKTRPGYLKMAIKKDGARKSGLTINYNNNFLENYIGNPTKDDPFFCYSEKLPADHDVLLEYYPEKNDTANRAPLSPWFVKMEKLWHEFNDAQRAAWDPKFPHRNQTLQLTDEVVKKFVCHHMYHLRDIEVICDPRILTNKSKALTEFIKCRDQFGTIITSKSGMPCM